ncbi:MFS transporter [Gallaecimonas kandeliae]|uniref:MDR family MFS transporter n=1 Tax=Gallaecimonas kandeliae TaxID=3029055 RepID=UPI002649D826|nr:MFS transporter [Gallaecimonas kandeliae]WKE65397.1 MFS transporter [Gallaecimonas kandeliae]
MESALSLSRLKSFPPLVWIILLGTFFARGSFFMIWPFLSVLLYQKFGLSAYDIGLILSLSALGSAVLGFYVSALSDRFGRRGILYFAGLLSALAFLVLAGADSLLAYILGIALTSIARAIWEPAAQALMGDQLPERKTRELALQARYFLVNVGAAMGPLVGVWAGLTAQQSTFNLTALAYLALVAALAWAFRRHPVAPAPGQGQGSFRQTLRLLGEDKVFLVLILANILMMFVFAHIDSSLIQYLTRAGAPRLVELISAMILVNALTIVLLQFPLLKWMEKMSLTQRMQVGMVLMTASQLWFAFNPMDSYWGWMGATLVLSLGEVILFPSINVQIDSMAPPRLRGAYFGAGALYSIGWALAPMVGGWVLDHYSGRALYLAMALCSLGVMLLYLLAGRLKRPAWIEQELAEG